MKVTIQDCNAEARRLWLQAVDSSTTILKIDPHLKRQSVRSQFGYLLGALDKAGQTVNILTRQESKKKWRYSYDVQHNFKVIKHRKNRNTAKLDVYKLYLRYVKETAEALH